VAPPPGPLVDANGLQGWGVGHRGRPHQAESGGGTGGEPPVGRESGASAPAEGHGDRLQGRDDAIGVPRIRRDDVREALRENAARTGEGSAEDLPDRELDMYGARPPGEIPQVALVTAMDGGGGQTAAGAGRSWDDGGELAPDGGLLHGDVGEAHPMPGW
jgi:hypothetical protein